MENPKRARGWKRRLRPRVGLKNDEHVLYSTHFHGHGYHFYVLLIPLAHVSLERWRRTRPDNRLKTTVTA